MTAAVGPVHGSLEDLVSNATSRRPLEASDGKSGATLEVVEIGDRRYVLKHVGGAGDWLARASGDLDCRAVRVWASGLLDAVPDEIDHAVVAAAYGPTRQQGTVLQRDVGRWLVPPGDGLLPHHHHERFIDHMAMLHASFWDFADPVGLLPLESRYLLLAPTVADAERARGRAPDPLPLIREGWERLATLAPHAERIATDILATPSQLTEPLRRTPQTLLHGDWKAGNLGVDGDGRTILIDWTVPGPGPGCADLAWYLAINAARLPVSKEATIATYRTALQRRGIDTSGWWDQQLALGLVGAFVMLGWEKALGDPDELAWWIDRVESAATWLS